MNKRGHECVRFTNTSSFVLIKFVFLNFKKMLETNKNTIYLKTAQYVYESVVI